MTHTCAPTELELAWSRTLFPNAQPNPGTILFARRAIERTAGLQARIDELETELAWWQANHWREQ